MGSIAFILLKIIDVYWWLLIIAIFSSWIPGLNPYNQPWRTLHALTEPVMAPFRQLIPPIGGIDLSPMILFLVLNFVRGMLASIASPVGF
jgi:YggT family protein